MSLTKRIPESTLAYGAETAVECLGDNDSQKITGDKSDLNFLGNFQLMQKVK